MKATQSVLLAAAIMALSVPSLASDADEQAALQAAGKWVTLLDKGQYKQTWQSAADYFKGNVKEAQWEMQARGVRAPLGKVIDRKVKSQTYTKTLPGAPDGEYVVVQYATDFANKKAAVETVTPMKEKNGQWRVSGYFIR